METYAIRRKSAWNSADHFRDMVARSKQVADDEFTADLRWIRSNVVAEGDGTLGSICIFQAVAPDAIHRHARRVGIPADEVHNLSDLIVLRPDPARGGLR